MRKSFWIESIPSRKERKCKYCEHPAIYIVDSKTPVCRRHLSIEIDMAISDERLFDKSQ